jgi:Domain of unknown function (DUF4252)
MKRTGYLLVLALLPMMTLAQGATIKMPDFSELSKKATRSVDISLDGITLQSAGAFLGGGKGGDAEFNLLIKGLNGIVVRVLNFEKPGLYSMRDIEAVIHQVESQGWKRLLSMRDKGEQVEMWMRDNNVNGGMLFVATKPTELVLINIAGNVNLESLRKLEGRMGVPFMPPGVGFTPSATPAPPAPPAK